MLQTQPRPLSRQPGSLFSPMPVAVVTLAILAVFYLYWPVWRAFLPLELNPNEPWNAWHTDRLFNGLPLYPSPNDLIVNNYPPLSFYVTGLAAKLTGDPILAGRLLSLIATVAIGVSVSFCLRALGASASAAALGGLWVVAVLARFLLKYVGVNDPNLLALAIMGGGMAWFLARLRAGQSLAPAIACMVLAGFFKHNLVVLPAASFLWLYLVRRDLFLRAVLTGGALAALGLAACVALYGGDFISQMLLSRTMTAGHVLKIVNKVQWVAPALLVWAMWAWPNRQQPIVQLTAMLVIGSLGTALLQAAGAGVSVNIFFELIFASGVAIGVAIDGLVDTAFGRRFGVGFAQSAIAAALVARLLFAQQLEPYLVITSPAFRAGIANDVALMNREVAKVAAIPGSVTCSINTACYRAKKPFVYDAFWMNQRVETKTWTPQRLQAAIDTAQIKFETIDPAVYMEKQRLF